MRDWVAAAAVLLFSSLVLGIVGGLITARWPSFTGRTRWLLTAAGAACGVVALVGGKLSAPAPTAAAGDVAPKVCKEDYPSTARDPLAVNLVVRDSDGCFKPRVATLDSGSTKTLAIRYQNGSHDIQNDVVIRVNLPPGVLLVPNSTDVLNGNTDGWKRAQTNNIATGGVIIGDYLPGGGAYVRFDVTVPFDADLECGLTKLEAVGVARPDGLNEYYNTAEIDVVRSC